MHRKRTSLLLGIALALAAAAPLAMASSTVAVRSYDGSQTVHYRCQNTCVVMTNGTNKEVVDSQGGYVDIILVEYHTSEGPMG